MRRRSGAALCLVGASFASRLTLPHPRSDAQLAALIHEWDPYHPVGTATPDINAATLYSLNALAPNLDVLGSNVYGAAMASNILVGANTAPSAANKLTVTLPLGAAGTAYEVVPVYPNAIFGGCCTGSAATCSISGVTGATGAAISTPFANASCIWAKPGAGGALGTGPLKPFFLSELARHPALRARVLACACLSVCSRASDRGAPPPRASHPRGTGTGQLVAGGPDAVR